MGLKNAIKTTIDNVKRINMAEPFLNLMRDLTKFEDERSKEILSTLPIILILMSVFFVIISYIANLGIFFALYIGTFLLLLLAMLPIYLFFRIIKRSKTKSKPLIRKPF